MKLAYLLIPFILSIQFAQANIVVVKASGKAFVFKQKNTPPATLNNFTNLKAGQILSTGPSSSIVLDFENSGLVYIAENSVVLIRGTSPRGTSLLSLLKGRIHYQNKVEWSDRQPGVIINVRNQDTGFMGHAFLLEYTEHKKELLIQEGRLWKVPLTLKSASERIEDEEEEIDEEDAEEIEQLLFSADEFGQMVEERRERARERTGGVEIKDERKTKIDFKAILRGVHYSSKSKDKLLTETTFNNDTTEDLTFRNLNPKQNVFDGRIEWRMERQIDKAVVVGSGWLEYGSENEIYHDIFQIFNDRKKTRGIIEFNELYFQNSWDNADLTIGKRVLKSGFGIITNPVDNITPKDLYDPVDQKDLGNWMVLGDYYFKGGGSFTYSLIPFFLTHKKYVSPVEDSIGNRINPIVDYPDSTMQDFSHYLRYKTTFDGYDFYIAGFHGHSLFPIYRARADRDSTTSTGIKEHAFEDYIKVNQFSLGLSTTFKSAALYSDWLYQTAPDKNDDSFVQALFGIQEKFGTIASWFGLNQIHLIQEFTYTHFVSELEKTTTAELVGHLNNNTNVDTIEGYVASSSQERSFNKNLLTRLSFEYSEQTSFAVTYNRDFFNNSQTYQVGFELRPIDNLMVKLYYENYSQKLKLSPDGTGFTFGGFRIDPKGGERDFTFDRVTLKMEYAF